MPYFMTDYLNGTLFIKSLSMTDIGSYAIDLVGVDDAGWYTVVPFLVSVNRNYIFRFLCFL